MFIQVENDLGRIRNASNQQELMDCFKEFGKSVVELSERAAQRQNVSSFVDVSVLKTIVQVTSNFYSNSACP